MCSNDCYLNPYCNIARDIDVRKFETLNKIRISKIPYNNLFSLNSNIYICIKLLCFYTIVIFICKILNKIFSVTFCMAIYVKTAFMCG